MPSSARQLGRACRRAEPTPARPPPPAPAVTRNPYVSTYVWSNTSQHGRLAYSKRGHVLDVEGGAEGVVVRGLVGEAPAAPVDHDRVRQRALAVDEDPTQRVVLDRHVADGDPPRLAHVGDHRSGLHRHQQAVAGARLHRHRVGHRSAQERPHEVARSTRTRRRRGRRPSSPGPRADRPACPRRRRRPRRPRRSALVRRDDVRGSMPRSRHARSSRPASACPQPRSLRSLRRACSSADGGSGHGLAERGLAHRDVRVGEVRRRRHARRPTRRARRTGRSGTRACGRRSGLPPGNSGW